MAHTVRCCRLIVAEIVLRIPLMIKLLIIRKTTLTSSCGLLLLLYLEITGGCLVGLLVVMVAERPWDGRATTPAIHHAQIFIHTSSAKQKMSRLLLRVNRNTLCTINSCPVVSTVSSWKVWLKNTLVFWNQTKIQHQHRCVLYFSMYPKNRVVMYVIVISIYDTHESFPQLLPYC